MAKQASLIARLEASDNMSRTIDNVRKSVTELQQQGNKLDTIQKRFDKINSSSAPVGRKLSDIKKQMAELIASGNKDTKLFKEMAAQAQDLKKQLDAVNEAMRDVEKEGASMSDKISMKADDLGFPQVGKILGAVATPAGAATAAVALVGKTMIDAGKKAGEFEQHLDDLQALTGLTDEKMKGVSATALDMSKKHAIAANEIVDSMGKIGSQAPELLSNADALAFVTDAAMYLAKAGSISAEAAGTAITTVTNQMGVSASEAMNIANTLEAAEQQGAASVEYLNKAIEKSGTQAKAAGMSYVDLAAMIETVAPKFSSADVAGSQLNSTLLKLSMGADEFNPAVVGMSQALQNLSDAQLTNEQLSKMVGEANITMVKTMIDGKATFDGFTTSLAGTNAAVESAAIKSDNFAGKTEKLKATWDAFLITLGQSGLIQGIADNIMLVMEALGEVINVISDVIDAFDDFGGTGEQNINLLEVQLDFLVGVIRGIGEVLQIVIKIASKVFEGIRNAGANCAEWIGEKWTALKNVLGDNAFARFVINAFNAIMEKVAKVINKIKEWWNNLKKSLGLSVDATATVSANTGTTNVENAPTATNDVAGGTPPTTTTTSTKGGKTPKSTTPKASEKPQAEAGSIKALQDQVTALNNELNNTVVSDERLQEILAEKEALEQQIETLKKRNGLIKETPKAETPTVDPNSLDERRKKYQSANSAIGQVKADFKLGLIDKSEAERAIAEANAMIEEIGLQPIELHVNDDGTITNSLEELEAYQARMNETASMIGSVGGAFSALGDAVGGTGGKMLEMAGQSANAVAQMLPQIIGLIGAKQGEALASGTASAAALPFPANIAAIASIIATITGLFASFMGSFADGGIVGGNSFHGDTAYARVNGGEMILNSGQQANLFRALNSGGVGVQGGGGNVEFKISGTMLKGVLKNHDSKMSKLK